MFNEMPKTYSKTISENLIKKYLYSLKSGVFEDVVNGYVPGELW